MSGVFDTGVGTRFDDDWVTAIAPLRLEYLDPLDDPRASAPAQGHKL